MKKYEPNMNLERLSRLELASLLASHPAGPLRQQIRTECRRRAQRWDMVAGRALISLLACLGLLQLLLLLKNVF